MTKQDVASVDKTACYPDLARMKLIKHGQVVGELDVDSDFVELPASWTVLTTWVPAEQTSLDWLQALRGGRKILICSGKTPAQHYCDEVICRKFIDGQPFIDWILDNYHSLPPYLITGHFPFDHNADWLAQLRDVVEHPRPYTDLCEPLAASRRAFSPDGRQHRLGPGGLDNTLGWRPRCLRLVWHNLFKPEIPEVLSPTSANYLSAIRAELILNRTYAFWQRVKSIADLACYEYRATKYQHHPELSWDVGYALETLWRYLFNPELETWL